MINKYVSVILATFHNVCSHRCLQDCMSFHPDLPFPDDINVPDQEEASFRNSAGAVPSM